MCSLEDIVVMLDLNLLDRKKCVDLLYFGVTTEEGVKVATEPYIGHRRSGRQEMKGGMIDQKRTPHHKRRISASQPHLSIRH